MYTVVSEREEFLGKMVVNTAFRIHKQLGPGLLESVYEKCFCYELGRNNIIFSSQQLIPIVYEGLKIDNGLRLDLFIEDKVVVELKAFENYHPVWEAQLLSYLKLTNTHLGLLINFHVPLIKDGIKRFIR
jgi:GxxExxY protein